MILLIPRECQGSSGTGATAPGNESSFSIFCLKLAEENGVDSIAFCCISTGVFGFPQREAAEIAISTVKRHKKTTKSDIKVIFNVFKDDDYAIYSKLLRS